MSGELTSLAEPDSSACRLLEHPESGLPSGSLACALVRLPGRPSCRAQPLAAYATSGDGRPPAAELSASLVLEQSATYWRLVKTTRAYILNFDRQYRPRPGSSDQAGRTGSGRRARPKRAACTKWCAPLAARTIWMTLFRNGQQRRRRRRALGPTGERARDEEQVQSSERALDARGNICACSWHASRQFWRPNACGGPGTIAPGQVQ